MICPMCGENFKDKLQFCPKCGLNVVYSMQHNSESDAIEKLENERRISVKNIRATESRIPTVKAVFKEAFKKTVGELLWVLVFFILGNLAAIITTLCIIVGVEENISEACLAVVFSLVFAWIFPMVEFYKRMTQRDTQIDNLNKEKDHLSEIENRIKMLSKNKSKSK